MTSEKEVKHLNITVTGRVQGVGFRANTRRQAKRLGIKGFVRNEQDGSVYIEAEGTDEELKELLDWLEQGGPRFAKVDNIIKEKGKLKNYSDFRVQR
ncbi:MAG: acylphosphatase [Patescibacteria group bacterium]